MSEHAHVDGIYPRPAVMQTRTIETNGTSIHVRVVGHGAAVAMLHGFGTMGDMWGHLASALIEDHIPHPKEPRMSSTVLPTFFRRFRRVAAGLALGALPAHAAPTPFPADFRSSQVVNADATIIVPNAGHWLMEEAPAATIAAVQNFLAAQ